MSGVAAGRRFLAPADERGRRLVAWDCAAAVAFAAFFTALSAAQHDGRVPYPAAFPLLAAMGLPLAVRRLWPGAVALAVTLASGAAAALGVVSEPLLAVAYALYAVAVARPWSNRTLTRAVAAVSGAVLLVLVAVGPPEGFERGVPAWLTGAVVAALAWAAGQAVRQRRAYAQRAARELAAGAVAEERLRIARELHDVVAHHVGVIAVKASVARHVAGQRPEEAVEALGVIDAESRTALREMRDMLGLLRAEAHPGGADPEGARHPGRRLSDPADVAALVERARAARVTVELHTDDLRALPDGLARSGYRVLQEALTNVMKHAAPCRCRVTLLVEDGATGGTGGTGARADGTGARDAAGSRARASQDASPPDSTLLLDLTDDGDTGGTSAGGAGSGSRQAQRAAARGAARDRTRGPAAEGGHGIIGMRERVALYGGELTAGPVPGGFAVRARVPFRRESGTRHATHHGTRTASEGTVHTP